MLIFSSFTVMCCAFSVVVSLLAQKAQNIDVPSDNDYALAHNITELYFSSFSWETFKDNLNCK